MNKKESGGLITQCNSLLESLRKTNKLLQFRTDDLKYVEAVLKNVSELSEERRKTLRRIFDAWITTMEDTKRSYKQRYQKLSKVIGEMSVHLITKTGSEQLSEKVKDWKLK